MQKASWMYVPEDTHRDYNNSEAHIFFKRPCVGLWTADTGNAGGAGKRRRIDGCIYFYKIFAAMQ
jgi:hypothetical protein